MRKHSIVRSVLALVAACLVIASLPAPAVADVTISAAPSLLEVSATPGGFGSQDVTVTNAGTEPFGVVAEVSQYKGADGTLSGVKWLTVDPASFDLAPGQRRTVRVTIAVPSDAQSGGKYAMIAFRTGGKAGEGSTVGVAAQVGVPFLITVKGSGALVRQPNLEGLIPVLEPSGMLGFRVPAGNKGNVHFYAKGSVDVAESSGRPLGTVTLRDSTAILPGTKEILLSDQTLPFKEGAAYKAKAAVSLGEGTPDGRVEANFDATTGLEIEEVTPQVTSAGDLTVQLSLKNTGGLGLLPRVMMAVRGEDGKVAAALSPSQQPAVWPNQAIEVQAKYPGKLAAGSYALVARVEYGTASVQREAPFKVITSTARNDSSLPVSKWAEANTKPAPEAAGGLPTSEISKQSSDGGSSPIPLVLGALGVVMVAAVAVVTRRGRRVSILEQVRLALPSPSAFGFASGEQPLRRRRRSAQPVYRVETLPPAPIHLLPPPVELEERPREEWEPIHQPGTAANRAGDGTAPSRDAAPSRPEPLAERAPGTVHDQVEAAPRPRTRLASAVAEKAAKLVQDASRAAAQGDRAAVDRISRQALKLDPWNVDAWLWLAASCEDPKSARLCLEAVILLDPSNMKARRGLANIEGRSTARTATGLSREESPTDGGLRTTRGSRTPRA